MNSVDDDKRYTMWMYMAVGGQFIVILGGVFLTRALASLTVGSVHDIIFFIGILTTLLLMLGFPSILAVILEKSRKWVIF